MAKTRKPAPQDDRTDNRIWMGVEGEGLSPKSFDVAATLAFVSAFVTAMKATANVGKQDFGLHSLAVVPGSAAFAMEAENAMLAQAVLGQTRLYIVGEADPPHGVKGAVTKLRKTLEELPASHRPFVEVKRKRELLPTSFGTVGLRVEITNVRGIVASAGGMNQSRVHLAVEGEGVINPRASRKLAERAGKHLYQHVDAVITLERDGDKILESSTMLEFEVIQEMSADDEIKRWKEWFTQIGGDWEEIDDIERELGRSPAHEPLPET